MDLSVENQGVIELRRSILAGQQQLDAAALAVVTLWETPCLPPEGPPVSDSSSDQAWKPRRAFGHALLAADHMIGYPVELARRTVRDESDILPLDAFMNGRDGYDEEARKVVQGLNSPGAAVALARPRWERLNASLETLEDAALELPAEIHPVWRSYLAVFGFDAPATVRTVLTVAACHLHDHADQIGRAAASP